MNHLIEGSYHIRCLQVLQYYFEVRPPRGFTTECDEGTYDTKVAYDMECVEFFSEETGGVGSVLQIDKGFIIMVDGGVGHSALPPQIGHLEGVGVSVMHESTGTD